MTSSHPKAGESGRVHLLLVDDDRDFVSLASALLESESEWIETTTDTNPLNAFDRLDVGEVTVSWRLPDARYGRDQFPETVREEYPRPPFILFTGKGNEEVAERAISADGSDYIVKDGSPKQYAISANRIENLVLQYRTEQRAIKQQVLDMLSQAVIRTILNEPTWEAIERGVCDRLVTFNLYSFVWIGERNSRIGEIQPGRGLARRDSSSRSGCRRTEIPHEASKKGSSRPGSDGSRRITPKPDRGVRRPNAVESSPQSGSRSSRKDFPTEYSACTPNRRMRSACRS